jgi:glycosyltransferase involved in cell wall biosynthesis
MKIAFGIIVYNGDFVLKECIESIYPYASEILISEGCVQHFKDKGFTTSTDRTNEIIDNFPDPDNKIKVFHGTYKEKTEQCNAYMPIDADYLWCVDADEIYKPEDIDKIIMRLEIEEPTSVGFKSKTFFGGFDNVIGGFEARAEYRRIFKINKESKWANHRPPQIDNIEDAKHISGQSLADKGVYMYHYSYVWDRQVRDKVEYYKAKISKDNCIDDYYETVFKKWVDGDIMTRNIIEAKNNGVHEFKTSYRGDAYTEIFTGEHPEIMQQCIAREKQN